MEHQDYRYREILHREQEDKMKAEIEDLKDKVGDFGLSNDYLDYKMYELEDALEHKKVPLRSHLDKEKRYNFRKMMLENRCNMLEKHLVQMSVNATYNQRHLFEYMKYMEYQKDKVDKISQAWIDSDMRCVKEFKEV